jgi:UDP-N-acetylglucosamine 2-epimerase
MTKILFIPLNVNHAIIMNELLQYLKSPYIMVCHDRISANEKYRTEEILKSQNIHYTHFTQKIQRSERDSIFKECVSYFKIKKLINKLFDAHSPRVVVLGVDNELISVLFIKEAAKRNIKSVIIQEGSSRPDAVNVKMKTPRAYAEEMLRLVFGIHLGYKLHGTLNLFDKYFVAGQLTKETLIKRGVPSEKIVVTGQPKYDPFLKEAISNRNVEEENRTFLFAAGFHIIKDQANIEFLKTLIYSTADLGVRLIIKLHPRSSVFPEDIKKLFPHDSLEHYDILRESDTAVLGLLKQVYGVITVSSTVVTEALIMNREGIVVDYLAGDFQLPFKGYSAVHHINNVEDVAPVLEKSIQKKIPFENKKKLLKDNIYSLDGKSAKRAVEIIEGFCQS